MSQCPTYPLLAPQVNVARACRAGTDEVPIKISMTGWEEYQETGVHATAEEVDAWLASRGTENELPAPVRRKENMHPAQFATFSG